MLLSSVSFLSYICMGNRAIIRTPFDISTQNTAQILPEPQAIDEQFVSLLGNLLLLIPRFQLVRHPDTVFPFPFDHFPDRIGRDQVIPLFRVPCDPVLRVAVW